MIVFFSGVLVLSVFWHLTGAVACTLETMHNRRGQRTGINCQSTMDHGLFVLKENEVFYFNFETGESVVTSDI